jgi:hypothetical protein
VISAETGITPILKKRGEKRKMKRLILVLLVGGLVFFNAFGCWAEEEKPTAGADLGIFSKYIWRGYELSDNGPVIQPSASVGYKGFGFNLWGNLDLNVDDGAGNETSQFNETDMTLSYDTNIGPVGLGVGYIYYGLDGTFDSQELYVSAAWDTILAPTLTVYREIDHYPGWYVNFSISHSFDLPRGITLDLGGSAGYYLSNDSDFVKIDDNGNATTDKYNSLHDGLLTAGLTIPINNYFTVVPMIGYSFPLSNDADNLLKSTSFDGDSSSFLFGGLTVSFAF